MRCSSSRRAARRSGPLPTHELSLARPAELAQGASVGNYTIARVVGQGGWGTVYLARHAAIGSRVAIKVLAAHLASGTDACRRFFQEAKASSAIDSDHIVKVLDFGQLPTGQPYIVMEWLAGRSLKHLLDVEHRLQIPRALHIARQVARALGAAHRAGIIHRDLKPDNIFLVARDRDAEYVKILDFGIAKLEIPDSDVSSTRSGALLGTPYYMSPEQCAGGRALDARSDVYALGIVLYELVTGVRPFSAPGFGEILVQHLTEAPRSPRAILPSLPTSLDALILRMLEKPPNRRPASMEQVAEALGTPGAFDDPETTNASGERKRPSQPSTAAASGDHVAAKTDMGVLATLPPALSVRPGRRWRLAVVASAIAGLAFLGLLLALRPGGHRAASRGLASPISSVQGAKANDPPAILASPAPVAEEPQVTRQPVSPRREAKVKHTKKPPPRPRQPEPKRLERLDEEPDI